MSRLELEANLSYSDITNKYKQKVLVDPQTNTLPDTSFQLGSLRWSAMYAVQKNLGLRLDYILDRFKTDERTWNRWERYADRTRLSQDTNQLVNFIGFLGITRGN